MSSIFSKLINLAGNITGTLPIANGGTGQTTASASFNALSPMTTAGDVIYGGTSGAGTRLAAGTTSQVFVGGTTPSWGSVPSAALPAYVPGTTSGIVNSAGLTGATGGSAAGAGYVGQVLTSGAIGAGVTVTTSIVNVGSLALTAGNWIVFASLNMNGSASTTVYFNTYLSTTSASSSGTVEGVTYTLGLANLTGVGTSGTLLTSVSTSSTPTYYLNASINSGSQSAGAFLGYITAVRIS